MNAEAAATAFVETGFQMIDGDAVDGDDQRLRNVGPTLSRTGPAESRTYVPRRGAGQPLRLREVEQNRGRAEHEADQKRDCRAHLQT